MNLVWYKKWFASRLASDPSARDPSILRNKNKLFKSIRGNVLELGPGTGNNFQFFPKGIIWHGLEPNRFVKPYLYKAAGKCDIRTPHLILGKAERIPFPDTTFDSVVSSHVLCSVENPKKVVTEILRVLKKNGSFYFLEHVRSAYLLRQMLQNAVTPLWSIIGDGCHPNRDIGNIIKQHPFRSVDITYFQIGIPVISDHISGRATK